MRKKSVVWPKILIWVIPFVVLSLIMLAAQFLPNTVLITDPSWIEPKRQSSTNGQLQTSLTADSSSIKMGNDTVTSYVYNAQYPGPTFVLNGGDTFKVKLTNHIPTEDTNLHFHGSHVSPKGNSDNVFARVQPHESFDFEYRLPDDHPPGLYWYHPHWHGYTDDQVGGGMAGAIIVKGNIDELPGIKGLPERLMVLTTHYESSTSAQPTRLVNGQANPTLNIRPGEVQRWRLLNASADDFYNFSIAGQEFYIISRDGNTLSHPVAATNEVMAPGDRIEVLVKGPKRGTYAVQSLAFNQGFTQYTEEDFIQLKSQGLPVIGMNIPKELLPYEDFRNVPIDGTRKLTFTVGGTNSEPIYMLDGKVFDSQRVDQTITLNTTEEWELINNSDEWHPFHIHVNPFQVIEINGQPVERYGYDDTFGIPARGSVKIRTRYTDFDGKFVLHCHILFHEDNGMMQVVRIVDPENPDASLKNSEFDVMHPHQHTEKSIDLRGRRVGVSESEHDQNDRTHQY